MSLHTGIRVLLAVLVLLPGCKNQVPGGASVPSGPRFGRTGGLLSFTSSAADPDGNNVSIRFDWGDGFKSGWLDPVHSGDTVTGSHRWADEDTYLIRAQARDTRGAESEWSDACSLRMLYNTWPEPPRLDDMLLSVLAGEAIRFDAWLSDPDGDSVSMLISWGDGTTNGWTALMASGQRVTLYHKWVDTGNYRISTQARDQYDMLSETDTCSIEVWRPRWRYRTGGNIEGCPAVAADGTTYFGASDGYLYALDPNGALTWRYATDGAVKSSPALAPDGTVYVGSSDSYFYAIDGNGTLKWRYQTGDSVSSSPALAADGTVYFGSLDGSVYAVDPSGALKWSFQTGGPVVSSPAVAADGTIYLAASADTGYLYAIDPNGAEKWRCVVGHTRSSPAIAADGTVYVGSSGLLAFDPTGTLKWRCQTEGDVTTSPVVGPDGTVYVGIEEWGCMYAIDHNGTITWYEYADNLLSTFALAADGTIYVPASGNLWAVDDAGDRDWKWGYKIGDEIRSSPAIATDGTVYIGSDDGYLYAIRGNSPLADAPWPKFHHDARNTGRVGGR